MRIRSIKPEFWTSQDIASHTWDDRLVFIGLWSYVDDNGVGRDVEKLIVADLFPLEEDPRDTLARVSGALARRSEAGRITRYTVDGRPFLSITNWAKHQRIDKPAKDRYPLPTCEDAEIRDTLATPSGDPRDTLAPGTGEQGNRRTDSFTSEVADAPSDIDDESDDVPPIEPREDVERICQRLQQRMVENGYVKPAITNRWRESARLLLDRDKRTEAQVLAAIDWAQNHEFWRANIKSLPKLRQQYDTLRLQASARGGKSNVHPVDFGAQPKDPKDRPLYAPDDVRSRWVK